MLAKRQWRPTSGMTLSCGLGIACLLLVCGCRVVQNTAELPGKAVHAVTPGQKTATVDPAELQQQLMRFADDFSARMVLGVDGLQHDGKPVNRLEIQRMRVAFINDTIAVATGPNPFANLLDMVVLVTLTRTTVETNWIPGSYGESARPLLQPCQGAETEIWRIAGTVMKAEQLQELRRAVEKWQKEHPAMGTALYTRALGLTAEMAADEPEKHSSGSVFSFLMLDPLSGLDPATREIARTRLLAERALYFSERLPLVIRNETELLTLNLMRVPEMQQMLTNTTQLSASADRISQAAQDLPDQLAAERKAIVQSFEEQQGKLSALLHDANQTLDAGEKMSTSLNTTLVTFDALMKRFGVGEPKPQRPASSNAVPFNILDYARTANELAATARELDTLMRSLNGTLDSRAWDQRLTEFKGLSDHAQSSATSVLNHAFLLGAGLILLAFLCAYLLRRFAPRPDRVRPTTPSST